MTLTERLVQFVLDSTHKFRSKHFLVGVSGKITGTKRETILLFRGIKKQNCESLSEIEPYHIIVESRYPNIFIDFSGRNFICEDIVDIDETRYRRDGKAWKK